MVFSGMGLMKYIKSSVSKINTYIENEQVILWSFLKNLVSLKAYLYSHKINDHGIFQAYFTVKSG
jgi:hypothetical protein